MNLVESLKIAWQSLLGNRLRSALTMLGVIIGVGAVIALVSIGQGASQQITSQIQQLGSNVITVIPRGNTIARLTLDDVKGLIERIPTLSRAIPSLARNMTVKWQNKTYDTSIEGTAEGYPELRSFPIGAGRFISQGDVDGRRKVAVIGKKVHTELFGELNPLLQPITINGETFIVIGVMSAKGQGMGGDFDDRVLIPITSAQRLFGTNRVSSILVQARDAAVAPATAARIQAIYQKKFPTRNPGRDDAVMVMSQDQLLSTVGDATKTFTIMLGGIAGISLLVGGIGIMNIMMVSVTERTREIGIRKALGAKRRDILSQFLVESVFLSLSGGVIGILIGIGGARAMSAFGLSSVMSAGSIILAFGFSAAVGLFFGVYPAMKAANLDPIEALRYD